MDFKNIDVPVIFLDLDDCVATSRARFATGDPIDASAAGLIRRLCQATSAKIVVISTWRSDADRCRDAFAKHGLIDHIWSPITVGSKSWKQDDITASWCVDNDNGSRSQTITRWLANHPQVKRWVIVDDSLSDLDQHQLDRLVQPDMHFGFGFADFARAQRILGFHVDQQPTDFADPTGAYQSPRHTISNQITQALNAIDQGDLASAAAILAIVRDCPAAQ